MSLNPRVICSVIAILALTACGGADHAISEIDSDIPGEFIVARDSDDDDRGELFVVAADGSEAQAIGNGDGFWGLALSPDGQTVAAVQAAENAQPIVVVDLATGTVSPVAVSAGSYSSPAWSPSGDRFAFTGIDYSRLGGSGVFGDLIYIADTDGSEARLLSVNGPDGSVAPTWSFDGSQVAYVRTSAIWVGRADGTDVRQVSEGMQSVFSPDWSPVDDWIVFAGYKDQFSAVYLVNADGSEQRTLSPEGVVGAEPVWSPDGSWIAFTGHDINSGSPQLHLIRPDESDHRVIELPKGAHRLSWSPDSQWIAFTTAYRESDGPITAIHLSVINPFEDDPEAHTLLRDLVDHSSPAWR